ncbi:MAG: hypothetical protein ACRENX_02100 [Candidatus Dormibacteria bacterium]
MIWVAAPSTVRLRPVLARDGVETVGLWKGWMFAEDRYRQEHHPEQRANLVVSGAPTVFHGPEREFLQLTKRRSARPQ